MRVLDKQNLDEAVKILKQGGILVFPTETAYGLGCDATNQKAVDKIFQIKGRPEDKSILVVVPDVEMAKKYLSWNAWLNKISYKYWPGPLTVVGNFIGAFFAKQGLAKVSRQYFLAKGVVTPSDTIGVRVTAHPVVKYLSEQLGVPLVATSANIAGAGNLYDARAVEEMFTGREFQPDAILDFGILPSNPPTTVVSIVDGAIKILRQGEIKVEIT